MVIRLLFIISMLVALPCEAVQVIANPSVEIKQLTTSQLRRIYSMRQTVWPNGQAIHVIVLPSKSAIHQTFVKEQLKLFPYQLENVWNKLTYSGVGKRPREVSTEAELVQAILETPHAIGYVSLAHPLQGALQIEVTK